ncbi:MAG: BatA domain-containing protein [Melioribacteraceae bacterium]|nr:BatA domain-containing protein [Melioribacteraceae bacterium]MCF8355014.1 BatA domain-containing protein [Melioribacteraceae bacterium]MCF8394339.1 BatA domain-containing protein [Melioribacteraceae bacterium]MCF8420018.1 BatA domain-containing protein [Melioribacteraceae bacterium]
MVFLNPAILLGLIATSIPILIHFLNLRKLKRIEFSTLAFLKELQKTKIRKVKFKQWLLLLIRVLIITFLVFAFARPTLESVSIGGVSSSAKTSSVFVIDNSFSMNLITNDGSYINRAKQSAVLLLEEFQSGDEAAVITTGGNNADAKFLKSIDEIKTAVNNIETADAAGNLSGVIFAAGRLLEQSNNFNKEIFVLSDFQTSTLTGDKDESLENKNLFEENVKLYTIDFSEKEAVNLGLTGLQINNQIFEIDKPISFTAAVRNYSEVNQSTVASLFINGNRRAQQSVELNAGETKNITFETTLNNAGLIEVFAEIEDDDIANDNKYFAAFEVPGQIQTALFYNDPKDILFLETALLGNGEKERIQLNKFKLGQISSIDLQKYDLVIICGSGSENYSRLNSFINAGGKLILMPGSAATMESYNEILSSLSLPPVVSVSGDKLQGNSFQTFDEVDFEHPVFTNLFEGVKEPSIASPEIYYSLNINSGGKGKGVIKLVNHFDFLGEYNIENGKVILFNTAPDLRWSTFPIKGIFAPLINKLVYYLVSNTNQNNDVKAGESISINISNLSVPKLKIVMPNSTEEYIDLQNNGQAFFNYKNAVNSGIYKFYSDETLIDFRAVNIDNNESILSYLTEESMEEYLTEINFNGVHFELDPVSKFNEQIKQARFGSELWKIMLIIALLLALIEMIISRSAKKDLAEIVK